ncbi:hypothetical protein GRI34_12320 [Erythrobacter aquimaris]|uniref:Uncharacterized protein n=1 Tax=Qipengyuania aquimaris TaxID=255984 RepID=A0A6I4TS10_9SPHN|nr:hypothetical protein [Qipengyuania aquimaris]MXO97203.1 hypothetical protein [Qipengyuania aquimaris]
MKSSDTAPTASRRTLKLAVMAAVLGVAGCFTAAFSFAGTEAQATEQAETALVATR